MKSRLIGMVYASIAILLGTASHQCGAAPIVYNYVGNPYTFAEDPYTTDMFVTASIHLEDFLPGGLDFADISGLSGFVVTMSDGTRTLDSTSISVEVVAALVTTDADGLIVEWGMSAKDIADSHVISSSLPPITGLPTVPADSASNDAAAWLYAYVVDNPGTWTVVPIPPAVWLFGSGLLGLIGIARKKKAA
jgi:hypothetical protein